MHAPVAPVPMPDSEPGKSTPPPAHSSVPRRQKSGRSGDDVWMSTTAWRPVNAGIPIGSFHDITALWISPEPSHAKFLFMLLVPTPIQLFHAKLTCAEA